MKKFKFELGAEARDVVTGFKGVILYRVEHLTGCDGYGLQPKIDEKGEVPEVKQFDENRLEIIGSGVKIANSAKPEPVRTIPGGPQVSANKGNKSL